MSKFTSKTPVLPANNSWVKFIALGIIAFLLAVLFWKYYPANGGGVLATGTTETTQHTSSTNDTGLPSFLPTSSTSNLVAHTYYYLGYNERHEQAEWVAYELTQELLRRPNVPRDHRFEIDPLVTTGSAKHSDYSGSGYTRGHMAPAGDMSFDEQAMKESFYMSNMSPQLRQCNNGVWKELEEQSRDWVYHNKRLYIISGPVLTQGTLGKTKRGGVTIPSQYYKILLDDEGNEKKAIAFLVPNDRSDIRLQDMATTIDSVEQLTGINFFANYFETPNQESKFESTFDLSKWAFSEARYRLRVEKWNNE